MELISRQAALEMLNDNELERQADDVFDGDLHRYKRAAQRIIAQLPTIEPKRGTWIDVYYYSILDDGQVWQRHRIQHCSVCGYERKGDAPDKDTNYCPNCGAKMERSEE